MTTPWWVGAKPHPSIQEGKVNEALFEAELGEAIEERGPDEYRKAELFFEKTFLTGALKQLLLDALRTLSGEKAANPNVDLKTSFGGGKTHAELALYHLFQNPAESMQVPQVRQLVAEAGLGAPPPCRVVVLPCTRIDPTGRTTSEGLHIRTLWGELAYRLGGAPAFALVAEADAKMVAPSELPLEAVLRLAGPSLILVDETLHYVDKVSVLHGQGEDLAKETVAFFRELTSAVDGTSTAANTPPSMLVIALTASRIDQLSPHSQEWLGHLERQVDRLARSCTPIEGLEIHEVVRRRLFDSVDESAAHQTAQRYHQLYSSMGGLPAQYVDPAYRDKIAGSFPFHPELVTVLYERWGAKPGFQLTRSTLRFLALVLQDLWKRQQTVTADLIQMGHVSLSDSNIRAMAREVAGDPQWESVIGSDIAAPAAGKQKTKAELIDEERGDGQDLARQLATTLLLYSLGGGEHPEAARHEIRLACARDDVDDSSWDDLLERLRSRLFYLYFDSEEARYQFRKEPNVTSLQHTYRLGLKDSEVNAHADKQMLDRAVGFDSPSHRFAHIYYLPKHQPDLDDDSLKLVVLGFDHAMEDGKPTEAAQKAAMGLLERHGQKLREHRNTLLFCSPDGEGVRQARTCVADYLSWRKVQTNQTDWDRIGGAQQAIVKNQMEDTESAALQAIIQAYRWALVPSQDRTTDPLRLHPVPLGTYGPGKLIAPMVWDILTANAGAQWLLITLTAETFLERYGRLAWPESEKWVTTTQLWTRFTTQVGLPTLANDQVLLDMLRQGQQEGLLAIGSLSDAESARDQRDSYGHLYFKETMPPNVPVLGERWLVVRPGVYKQIAEQPEQVTPEEIATAFGTLGGDTQPVRIKVIRSYVAKDRSIDEGSFHEALGRLIKDQSYEYRLGEEVMPDLPEDLEQSLEGTLAKRKGPPPKPVPGRTIVIQGTLGSINDLAPFFNKLLKPLATQQPTTLTIAVKVEAHFEKDPGGGLDATLDDGFDKNAFPGLTMKDSKGS